MPQKSALDLWKLVVNWCLTKSHKSVEKILREGSQAMNREIASFSRLKYLHWSMHAPSTAEKQESGLSRVRKIYKRFLVFIKILGIRVVLYGTFLKSRPKAHPRILGYLLSGSLIYIR